MTNFLLSLHKFLWGAPALLMILGTGTYIGLRTRFVQLRLFPKALRELVKTEYEKAGITPESVDTGAVIITGETSRKENAAQVLASLSDLAGEFVVATAGPDLESVLAAKGAGATE